MTNVIRIGIGVAAMCAVAGASRASAQSTQAPPAPAPPIIVGPPPPPATELEAFSPPAGSLVTVGHERVGGIADIEVEVRDMRSSSGQHARGVVVSVREGNTPQQAFIDEDELDGLIHGIDALLAIGQNPTALRNFETSYATKGELIVTAGTLRNSNIMYAVVAGRVVKAEAGPLDAGVLQQLRNLIDAASRRLRMLPADR